jgi:sulfonate transport system substrate-binding protein
MHLMNNVGAKYAFWRERHVATALSQFTHYSAKKSIYPRKDFLFSVKGNNVEDMIVMRKLPLGKFVLMVAALLSISAVARSETTPLPKEIRIGVPDQSAGSKPFIGGPLGLAHIQHQLEDVFAPQGVTVKWSFFKGAGPAVNEALANQQLDFAYLGDLAAIIGRASGLPTRFLFGHRGSSSYLAVNSQSGIKQIADLKGKRVAVYRGTADQLAFDRALKGAGLSERDMQVINLDWTSGKAALAAGRVDAVWGGVSLLALRGKGVDVVVKSRDLSWENTTQAGFIGTAAFIESYPQATQQIIDVLVKNALWTSEEEHRENYAKTLSAQSAIPQVLFLEELNPADLKFISSPRLDTFLQDSFQRSVEQAKNGNLIRRDFAVDQWFDNRFVEQALQSQQLEKYWPAYNARGDQENAG